jgi:hypothetical protein
MSPQAAHLWGPARAYVQARRRALGQEFLPAPDVAPSVAEIMDQLDQIASTIRLERAADAADYQKYAEAAKNRLDLVAKQKAAFDKLSEQERLWASAHRNQDALTAAQTDFDQTTAQLADQQAEVDRLRAEVDRHGKTILEWRRAAADWVNALPPEMQAEGRRKIDPEYRQSGPPKKAVVSAGPYLGGIRLAQVPLAPAWRPSPRPFLSQLVEVRPQVTIPISAPITTPINIDLGSLPLSIGLFAGSGITFLVRSGVPEGWPQAAATVVGSGLALAGVVNLFLKKSAPAQPAAPPPPLPPAAGPPPPPPAGATAAEAPAFTPPSPSAFVGLQFELVSPRPGQEIAHLGWFLTSDRIPVTIRIFNPSPERTTFNLEFEWEEFPSFATFNTSPSKSSKSFQVTLGPGEEQNQNFELPIASGSGWTSMAVALSVYKKRTPTDNRVLIVNSTFNVT